MDSHVVDCEVAERDACGCRREPSLNILKDVQRAYEERLQRIEAMGGAKKMQMRVQVLQSWVDDLVGQNALLVRAVEDLESEATSRLVTERRKHQEIVCELRAEVMALRRRLTRKDSDLRGLIEVLRRLREFDYCTLKGIHFFEVTESDIFGHLDWRQGKMAQGDSRRERERDAGLSLPPRNKTKHELSNLKTRRHLTFL